MCHTVDVIFTRYIFMSHINTMTTEISVTVDYIATDLLSVSSKSSINQNDSDPSIVIVIPYMRGQLPFKV